MFTFKRSDSITHIILAHVTHWSISDSGILIIYMTSGERIMMGKQAVEFNIAMIAYLGGDK